MERLQQPTGWFYPVFVVLVCTIFMLSGNRAFAQNDSIAPSLTDSSLIAYLASNYYPSSPRSYNAARDSMYQYLDVDATDSLTCVYSGLRAKADGSRTPSNGSLSFNTEHSWPQSFYNENEPMRGDIHHLYPTWSSPNQSRSNHPFSEVPDDSTTSWWYWANGGSISSIPTSNIDSYSEYYGGRFEPRESHKGNLARAMFYFWTIYQTNSDVVNDESDNTAFFEGMKETLYVWHKQDPVDAAELNRSLGVESIQGNRNPFIHDTTLVRRAFFNNGSTSNSSSSNLYISEVFEANGGRVKYIELYNQSDSTIDLNSDSWAIWRFSNANTSHSSISLTGSIEPKSFFVIGDDNESDGVQTVFGEGIVDQENSGINHNGNDKYLLVKNSTTSPDTIDSFGKDNIGNSSSFYTNQVAYRVFSALPNDGIFGQTTLSANGDTVASGNWVVYSVSSSNSNARFVATPGFNKGIETDQKTEALISGDAGWRLLSIPAHNATISQLSDDIALQGVNDSNDPNVFSFNASGSYEAITNSSSILPNGEGLAVYFFDNSEVESSALPVVLDTNLPEPSANVTVSLNTTISTNGSYFTLVGNPFQSNFSTTSITSSGSIQNNIHVLNNGLYSAVSRLSNTLLPWQGFWIESDAVNPATQITFPISGKTNDAASVWAYDKSVEVNAFIQIGLRSATIEDQGCIISYNPLAEFSRDAFDASKLTPQRPDYSILSCDYQDQKHSILAIPPTKEMVEIPLMVESTFLNIPLELFWEIPESLAKSYQFQLFDQELKTQVNLSAENSYPFQYALTENQDSRFLFIIEPLSVSNEQDNSDKAYSFSLHQNYPNPFNPSTTIKFSLPEHGHVHLQIVNMLGQTVQVLADEFRSSGSHTVTFDASNLSSGVYVYQLEFDGKVLSNKMILMK